MDRGPGTASTIGYATFGGTLALYSKDPLDTFGAQAYSTFGSFGEQLYGVEVDSGAVPTLGGGRGFLDLDRLQTGSYLTGVTTDRSNAFGKWEQPLGSNTLVTFVGMYNNSTGHTAYGSSLAEIAKYGPDYGLSFNPHSQDFFGYNNDRYDTDFEYIRIASALAMAGTSRRHHTLPRISAAAQRAPTRTATPRTSRPVAPRPTSTAYASTR